MKERPIPFSGPMVRAILDGSKTQTRRVVKPQPEWNNSQLAQGCWEMYLTPKRKGDSRSWFKPDEIQRAVPFCPYGKVADCLWVRETHMIESNFNIDSNDSYPPPFKDGRPVNWVEDHQYGDHWEQCHYAATDEKPELCGDGDKLLGWRPSRFMPRWASRITLEIIEVRVQQLQDISKEDVIAEGITEREGYPIADCHAGWYEPFAALWDSINGKTYPWESNPWVWALTFKRIPSEAQ
jgi:hypothetical protein